MTRFRLISALVLLSTLLLAGCSDYSVNLGPGSGRISPRLNVDATIVSGTSQSVVSAVQPVPGPEDFLIRLHGGTVTSAWIPLLQYPDDELLLNGTYTVEMATDRTVSEGFDAPYFQGSTTVEVAGDMQATATVTARLGNTPVSVEFAPGFDELISDCTVRLHSREGCYLDVYRHEYRTAYLRPGDITVGLNLELPDGNRVDISPMVIRNAGAGRFYQLMVSASRSGNVTSVMLSTDAQSTADDVIIRLTPEFLAAAAPKVLPVGFDPQVPFPVTEGIAPGPVTGFKITGAQPNTLLLTTTNAPMLTKAGWPAEVDLASMSSYTARKLKELGAEITPRSADNDTMIVDLSGVLAHLRQQDGDGNVRSGMTTFTLCSTAEDTKTSQAVTLQAMVRTMPLELLGASEVTVGVDRTTLTLFCPSEMNDTLLQIVARNVGEQRWLPMEIYEVRTNAIGETLIDCEVPGGTDDVELRLIYCGEIRSEVMLHRISPAFDVEVDAYALTAAVRIIPDDPEMLEYITEHATLYLNGSKSMTNYAINDKGYIILGGLRAGTTYKLKVSVMDNPWSSVYAPEVTFTTEEAMALPNGDFEEIQHTIDYPDMPSGGRYSQTIVEIFNRQNRTSFDLFTPKRWANINDKTFCKKASRHNTWYMAPSAYTVTDAFSGAYAVRLDCVGYDTDGEPIADYGQTGLPYTAYSQNIPEIRGRAAAKLFLGEYTYDYTAGTEVYRQGIACKSRPMAVNGYYKFMVTTAGVSEHGLVQVEVLGQYNGAEIVLASSRVELLPAHSYTAFSIPLEYSVFGAKATSIRLMFSASANIGSPAYEAANIPLLFDPETSTARGSSLWLDNINFSY